MPTDQAADLRRRGDRQPLHCVHCFSDFADSSVQLVHALHRLGQASLLVDVQGRLFADSPTRSLFDWRQQVGRGQLQFLPQTYGDGWFAPGVLADEPVLRKAAQGYDHVVFDVGWLGHELTLMSGPAAQTVVMVIQRSDESMRRAYALLKTLSRLEDMLSVGLLGDRMACDHVAAACRHFLEPRIARAVFSVAHEDDAIAVLAVRMSAKEASLRLVI